MKTKMKKTTAPKIAKLTPESAERMSTLAALFPCLAGVAGVAPFDAVLLLEEADRLRAEAVHAYASNPAIGDGAIQPAYDRTYAAGFLAWMVNRGCEAANINGILKGYEAAPAVSTAASVFDLGSFALGASRDTSLVLAAWILNPWFPTPMAPLALVSEEHVEWYIGRPPK